MMKPHKARSRRTIGRNRFYSRASGVILAALSMSALIVTGASSTSSPQSAQVSAPVAVHPPHTESGRAGKANVIEPATTSFHPGMLPLLGGTWTAEGPAPIQGGQATGNPNDQTHDMVIGAIKGVAVHPSDPKIIYVSTVNGGIWKTADGGGTWTPQTDTLNSLSGGPIKFDPTDGTHNTLIAGNGNFSSLASAGGPQSGVLLTTDG